MYRKKIIRDSLWTVLDYVSSLVIFLITTKILIQNIGVSGYGFYMFFTSLIGTFGLVDLGMGMAVSKYLSEFLHNKKIDEANQVITIALVFYLLIGLILFFIVLVLNSQIIRFLNFDKEYLEIGSTVLVIISLIFIINMLSTVMTNTLVALEEWKKISLVNILLKMLNAVLLVFLLVRAVSVVNKIQSVFVLLLCFSIVKFLVYFICAKCSFRDLKLVKPQEAVEVKMIKFLKVSAVQYALSLLVGHLDKFIISKIFGLEVLGLYSFVVNSFVYLYGFLCNIFKLFLPKLSKLHGANNREQLKVNFKMLLNYSLCISIILATVGVVSWNPFVSWYIDDAFAVNSFAFMQIFALYLVVRSAEPIFAYFFNAIAKPSVLVINLAIGSFTTILGYFIFIPIFNVFGLVTSQIVASITVYSFNFYMIKKKGFYEFAK